MIINVSLYVTKQKCDEVFFILYNEYHVKIIDKYLCCYLYTKLLEFYYLKLKSIGEKHTNVISI